MKKPFSKLLMAVGILLSAFFVLDFIAWVTTGDGLAEQIGGNRSPFFGAIARHIAGMPQWLFWPLAALSVVVLSFLIALAIVSLYRGELSE